MTAPTLHLHGAVDRCVLPGSAQGSGRYVTGRYDWRVLPDAGHFPHEEQPAVVNDALLRWLRET